MNINILQHFDNNSNVQYIFHIADIHISYNNKKHKNLSDIINKFVDIINHSFIHTSNNSIIVICGDFLDKSITNPPDTYNLAQQILIKLSNTLPTFLIPGNHDNNIKFQDPHNPIQSIDALSSIVNELPQLNKTLFYFKNTGINISIQKLSHL